MAAFERLLLFVLLPELAPPLKLPPYGPAKLGERLKVGDTAAYGLVLLGRGRLDIGSP